METLQPLFYAEFNSVIIRTKWFDLCLSSSKDELSCEGAWFTKLLDSSNGFKVLSSLELKYTYL